MVVTLTSSEFISVGNYRYVGENEYDKKAIGNVCNLLQSILRKIQKSSKFKKTLIVFFDYFLSAGSKKLVLLGILCSHAAFRFC